MIDPKMQTNNPFNELLDLWRSSPRIREDNWCIRRAHHRLLGQNSLYRYEKAIQLLLLAYLLSVISTAPPMETLIGKLCKLIDFSTS